MTVTDDDLYRHSSQFRIWSYTKDEYASQKAEVHDRAARKMAASLSEKGFSDIEYLSLQEEHDLVVFYASQIDKIARIFNMPSQIKATAISYFSKFYLVYSVMEYHPKNVMYTSVFLASKAENHFIPISKFCSMLPRTEPSDVLGLEFLLLQSLSFTLAVQNGLTPLHGFFLDMQTTFESSPQEKNMLGQLHDSARSIIIDGFISDVPFFYTPPQIALSAMLKANRDLTIKYLDAKFSDDADTKSFLLSVTEDCVQEFSKVQLPSADQGKALDKKLYICLNPDKKGKKRASPSADDPSTLKKLKSEPS